MEALQTYSFSTHPVFFLIKWYENNCPSNPTVVTPITSSSFRPKDTFMFCTAWNIQKLLQKVWTMIQIFITQSQIFSNLILVFLAMEKYREGHLYHNKYLSEWLMAQEGFSLLFPKQLLVPIPLAFQKPKSHWLADDQLSEFASFFFPVQLVNTQQQISLSQCRGRF